MYDVKSLITLPGKEDMHSQEKLCLRKKGYQSIHTLIQKSQLIDKSMRL